jgi:hypothetical protein
VQLLGSSSVEGQQRAAAALACCLAWDNISNQRVMVQAGAVPLLERLQGSTSSEDVRRQAAATLSCLERWNDGDESYRMMRLHASIEQWQK